MKAAKRLSGYYALYVVCRGTEGPVFRGCCESRTWLSLPPMIDATFALGVGRALTVAHDRTSKAIVTCRRTTLTAACKEGHRNFRRKHQDRIIQ